jgi:NAD(P)H-nitrite reductase large subunit
VNHFIVGNGPAGVVAAETIRKRDPAAVVRLLGDEPSPPYSRMAIPYLLMGEIGEDGTLLRKDRAHFERLGIESIRGRASAVDLLQGVVTLEDGRHLPFDRLLLATGSRPVRPSIPGIDSPGVHPCWTLADAREILRLARRGSRVVQLGAGFIGCIILEALASIGVELTVVEMGDRMVPRMMTPTAGALIKRWCESKGVKVLTSTRAESIARDASGTLRVKLSDGSTLAADLVISATGVRPNIDLARAMNLKTDVGVRVDETMRTSHPAVFAAGDVAQAEELYTGHFIVNAGQPNAVEQARIAAANMTGGNARSRGALALNVLDTLGLVAASFGQWQGVEGGDRVEEIDAERYRYVCLQFDGDTRLVGATTLGMTEQVGVLRGLIESRRPLGAWAQHLRRNPMDLMRAYLATAQAAA